jgi:hypothetical protein
MATTSGLLSFDMLNGVSSYNSAINLNEVNRAWAAIIINVWRAIDRHLEGENKIKMWRSVDPFSPCRH